MPGGTHEYIQDPRNDNVLIYINGEMLPRPEARVSVFDSGFLLGDGVWEGIRLHNGQLVFCEEHIDRLYTGAAAIGMDIGMSKNDLVAKIHDTLAANEMHSDIHLRLIISRGLKTTPYQADCGDLDDTEISLSLVRSSNHSICIKITCTRGCILADWMFRFPAGRHWE